MKKPLNIMAVLLALTVLLTVVLNASWMGNVANDRVSFLDDDPNEPDEPEFASALSWTFLGKLSDDPNEPGEPE
jgi:hypothetical protein